MKQIAYLSMIFLPASFVAACFGMNVKEIAGAETNGTLPIYFETALPLTVITIWIIIAFQSEHLFSEHSFCMRLLWPVLFLRRFSFFSRFSWIGRWTATRKKRKDDNEIISGRSNQVEMKNLHGHRRQNRAQNGDFNPSLLEAGRSLEAASENTLPV
ncbi:hypothetical protein VKT23_016262 [Stygiomarasmius scandens]|uniref:Uncharacterized protein n=1 Tax=Marasmiellus scandens TaxID=2682957 RepID=A0ABR1IY01_9AGAR